MRVALQITPPHAGGVAEQSDAGEGVHAVPLPLSPPRKGRGNRWCYA